MEWINTVKGTKAQFYIGAIGEVRYWTASSRLRLIGNQSTIIIFYFL